MHTLKHLHTTIMLSVVLCSSQLLSMNSGALSEPLSTEVAEVKEIQLSTLNSHQMHALSKGGGLPVQDAHDQADVCRYHIGQDEIQQEEKEAIVKKNDPVNVVAHPIEVTNGDRHPVCTRWVNRGLVIAGCLLLMDATFFGTLAYFNKVTTSDDSQVSGKKSAYDINKCSFSYPPDTLLGQDMTNKCWSYGVTGCAKGGQLYSPVQCPMLNVTDPAILMQKLIYNKTPQCGKFAAYCLSAYDCAQYDCVSYNSTADAHPAQNTESIMHALSQKINVLSQKKISRSLKSDTIEQNHQRSRMHALLGQKKMKHHDDLQLSKGTLNRANNQALPRPKNKKH